MRRYRWCVFLYFFYLCPAGAESAAHIMKKVDERYTGDTSRSEATLVLIDKRDRQRIRELVMFASEDPSVEKSVVFFRTPSDVKDTAYMSFDWKDDAKEDDSWLYLPALQKVTRVAASDESGAFMGSDFNYSDINGRDYPDFTYTMEKESDPVDGVDCWVIKSLPVNDQVVDATGYTEAVSWIRKDNYMMVKSVLHTQAGKRTKYYSATDIREVNGIWTAHTLQMVTTRNGKREHASVFKVRNVEYNTGVDETLFDTQAMQRGI